MRNERDREAKWQELSLELKFLRALWGSNLRAGVVWGVVSRSENTDAYSIEELSRLHKSKYGSKVKIGQYRSKLGC